MTTEEIRAFEKTLELCPCCESTQAPLLIVAPTKERAWICCAECKIQTETLPTPEEARKVWNSRRGQLNGQKAFDEFANASRLMAQAIMKIMAAIETEGRGKTKE